MVDGIQTLFEFARIPHMSTELPPVSIQKTIFSTVITLNKAHGQTLKFRGINLKESSFFQDQLYVACSRVRNLKNISIQI